MPKSTSPGAVTAVIRTAVLEDIPAILALEQGTLAAAHWTVEQYAARIQSGGEEACFLIAESHETVCGFLCAHIVAGEWEIENVVVAERFRRRGIGRDLMRALIAKWKEAAGTGLRLEVRESNTAARALYTNQGLRECGRRHAYYHDPVEDAILYALYDQYEPDGS